MERQEQLSIAASLMQYLYQHNQTGSTTIHPEAKQDLRRLYQDIYGVNPNVSCGSCLIHALSMLESWYERERYQ